MRLSEGSCKKKKKKGGKGVVEPELLKGEQKKINLLFFPPWPMNG